MSRIDTFEAMLARGQDSEMLRFTLGNAYLDEARPVEACAHLRRAVELKPDYSAAWKQLGRALAAADEPVAALAAFERGRAAGEANGDKQTLKEIAVFERRVRRALGGDVGTAGTGGATSDAPSSGDASPPDAAPDAPSPGTESGGTEAGG